MSSTTCVHRCLTRDVSVLVAIYVLHERKCCCLDRIVVTNTHGIRVNAVDLNRLCMYMFYIELYYHSWIIH